ncbi:MAG: hypothetical protein QXH44_07935 [Pyrobaculum sp.]
MIIDVGVVDKAQTLSPVPPAPLELVWIFQKLSTLSDFKNYKRV